MKIPKKVKIGAHTYTVMIEPQLSENHNLAGQSRHARGVIVLDKEQTQTQLEDTLLHEILHAINAQVKFIPDDRDTEEDAVSRLSPILLQVLKENSFL